MLRAVVLFCAVLAVSEAHYSKWGGLVKKIEDKLMKNSSAVRHRLEKAQFRGAFEAQTDIVQADGQVRDWDVYVPDGYNPNGAPMPALLALHPLVTNNRLFDWVSDMSPIADREGFIIIYPNGVGASWNGGPACCAPAFPDIDDIDFLRTVLRTAFQNYNIDRRRLVAHGFSNGAYMLSRLNCEGFGDYIVAMATSGSGSPWAPESMEDNGCSPTRPVPFIHFMGTEDVYDRAEEYVQELLKFNECREPFGQGQRTYAQGQAFCDAYTQCNPGTHIGGTNVTFCTAGGQGHSWPAYNPTLPNLITGPSRDVDNSLENWAFLSRYAFVADPPLP